MRRTLIILHLALLLLASAVAQAKSKPLDDAALDQVTAGGFTLTVGNGTFEVGLVNPTTISFTVKVATSKGMVEAFGTMSAESETAGGINISGNALSGAQSLITIIAANSKVNVLTNLVVLFNPTNVTINQGNSNH